MTDVPILFIIFNRPGTTKIVFDAIRSARPTRLYISADGPRPDRPTDAARCNEAREVVSNIDWPCTVERHYQEANLGCRDAVSTAIHWFFSREEQGIVLEDDVLPDPTFFPYCGELLERYRDDERVMAICGANFQNGVARGDYSYYFSHFVHVWGWATWRRAWRHFDVRMENWPEVKMRNMLSYHLGGDKRGIAYWTASFDAVAARRIDTWDYQWVFACWAQNGVSVLPNVNLVTNIGFGEDATHTTNEAGAAANMARNGVTFPLRHPPFLMCDAAADTVTAKGQFRRSVLPVRVARKLKKIVVAFFKGRGKG